MRGMNHEAGSTAGWDRTEKDGKPSVACAVFDFSAIEFWVMSRLMWNLDDDAGRRTARLFGGGGEAGAP